jgi:hypothetical protein
MMPGRTTHLIMPMLMNRMRRMTMQITIHNITLSPLPSITPAFTANFPLLLLLTSELLELHSSPTIPLPPLENKRNLRKSSTNQHSKSDPPIPTGCDA